MATEGFLGEGCLETAKKSRQDIDGTPEINAVPIQHTKKHLAPVVAVAETIMKEDGRIAPHIINLAIIAARWATSAESVVQDRNP